MAKFEKKPAKVEAWRTKGNRHVNTADGPREAKPGQWIVEVSDGVYAIVDDADFREQYEPKDNEAKKALSGELKTVDEEVAEQEEKAAEEDEKKVAKDSDDSQKAKAAESKKGGKK